MASVELLNATCVALATANYTLFNTTMGNLTACATPRPPFNYTWVVVALVSFLTGCQIGSLFMIAKTSKIIHNLWSTPSYELHRSLEKFYAGRLSKRDKKEFGKDHEGRYKFVMHTDDALSQTRTITIVEDLTKVPPEKKKEEEKGKNKRKDENIPLQTFTREDGRNAAPWTHLGQAWAHFQTRGSPFTDFEASMSLETTENVARAPSSSSNLKAAEGTSTQENMTVPTPAYNGAGHTWTDFV
jgi:hypothetical protein